MNLKAALEYILSNWSSAIQQPFTNNELAVFFRNNFHNIIRSQVDLVEKDWITKPSVGAGNWANVPWLSILNPKITRSTRDGIYPVYLFSADGSGVYLSLMQGVTEPTQKYGKKIAENRAQEIKATILQAIPELQAWDTSALNLKASTALGRSYQKPNIAAKYYPADALPDESVLLQDLQELMGIYKKIEHINWQPENRSTNTELNFSPKVTCTFLPKPFLLFAGISGTGKSRFVRKQAQMHGRADNFCLVAVRPDWHEPSDLLGYTSRLSGEAEYVATDVLRFLVAAWKSLLQTDVELDGDGERTSLAGDDNRIDAAIPYWLCLDEMNLAPVEQYFADYLSLIETREWYWENDNFVYSCDALLKPSALQNLKEDQQMALARELGLETEDEADADYELWQHFLNHGIAIPPNLIVAGTVNMDETTHGFSRKVIDRAMSFDFGEFFPNDFDDFYAGSISHIPLTFPRHSSGKEAIEKNDAEASIEFLKAVNNVLKGSPFELAYRALNELLLAVHCHGTPKPGADLQAVWDDFLMQKVLPRIEGDTDKLQSNGDQSLLTHLCEVLEVQLAEIWADDKIRIDFYRLKNDQPARTACRSRIKLQWMLERLDSSGFTSFWP